MSIQQLTGLVIVLGLSGLTGGLLILLYYLVFRGDEVVEDLTIRRMERRWNTSPSVQVGPDIEQIK